MSKLKVKLCGMRRTEDIEFINEFMPDYAGFILSSGFKRSVTDEMFYGLENQLDKKIKRVGVFVNEPIENIVRKYADRLDVIQLHGDEDLIYVQKLKKYFDSKIQIWKAVRVQSAMDIENAERLGADMLLLDAFVPNQYGGTGKTIDYKIIQNAKISTPFFLAGGLNCDNVMKIIRETDPYGVDVSGGIETDGAKDRNKIKKFMEIIRSV